MTNQLRLATLAVCLAAAVANTSAQTAPDLHFEVASLKPSPQGNGRPRPSSIAGGPGTATPNRLTVRDEFLRRLLLKAYAVKDYQLSAPAWVANPDYQGIADRFDIDAAITPGTTQEQFLVMLQNLLVARFGLKVHREQKELPVDFLVPGRNGHKLKENPTPELSNPPSWASLPRGADGFRAMPPGYTGSDFKLPSEGDMTWDIKFMRTSADSLAGSLSVFLRTPVLDRTGLSGNFDFRLTFNMKSTLPGLPDGHSDAPDIDTAVQSQLGLKLLPGKSLVEMLVIDHVDRTPSSN